MPIKEEFSRVFKEIEAEAEKWEEYLPDYDAESVCNIFAYMEQYMSGGKFKTGTLLPKTWDKTLTHEEFYDLCENILDLLDSGICDDFGTIPDYEVASLIIVEQAAALLPLNAEGCTAVVRLDIWQEMNGEEDIGLFDSYVSEMYFDPVCRQTIEDNALRGNDIGTALHIGMKIKVKCIVDGTCLVKGKIYEAVEESDGLWGLADDEDDGEYLYEPSCFEIIEVNDPAECRSSF